MWITNLYLLVKIQLIFGLFFWLNEFGKMQLLIGGNLEQNHDCMAKVYKVQVNNFPDQLQVFVCCFCFWDHVSIPENTIFNTDQVLPCVGTLKEKNRISFNILNNCLVCRLGLKIWIVILILSLKILHPPAALCERFYLNFLCSELTQVSRNCTSTTSPLCHRTFYKDTPLWCQNLCHYC